MRMDYAEKLQELCKDNNKRLQAERGLLSLLREVNEKMEIIMALEERDDHYQMDLQDALYHFHGFFDSLIGNEYATLKEAIKSAKAHRSYVKREMGL